MSLHSTKNLNQPWLFKLQGWNNRHSLYQFLKFILGCRFNFKAYAKNVRKKKKTCSLKTAKILLDADRHVLTEVWYFSKYSSSKLSRKPSKLLMSWFLSIKNSIWCLIWNSPSFLLDNMFVLWKNYIQVCGIVIDENLSRV